MPIELLAQALLNGFGLAVVYVLVALGLTLIFSILEVINFAHGEFYMLGGFATYYLFAVSGLNYGITLLLTVALVGLAGVVAERLVFRHLRGKTLNAFIVSLGLLWVLQATAQLSFGVLDKSVPSAVSGIVRVGGVIVSRERLFVMLVAVALIIGLYLFLKLTRPGQALRAVAQDADAAALQGVNIELVSALGFGIGCALAGAAGALLAPIFAVSPTMGALPVVKAFIIIIVGGMGSLPGAVLGGLLLGAVEGVGTLFMSSAAVNILGFLMVIAILLLRPRGLFGAA
ncbi:MAG TPA: branched-chain amino acid ABC transporter permease [Streptosporangiaceae bacterium]|nr:branched-chain amino acid ABC transporter permease [Streptosporangiaceae bacterium]